MQTKPTRVCVLLLLMMATACVCVAATGSHEHSEHTEIGSTPTSSNAFISTVLSDHVRIRSLASRFRGDQHDANTARALMDMLTLHDRRERALLYPLAAVLLTDKQTTELRNEHNTALLELIRLHGSDLSNATVLNDLDHVIDDVMDHVKEEESTLLPQLTQFLENRKKLTMALATKWKSTTNTALPLLTELIEAEHTTLRVLVAAFKMYSRAAIKRIRSTDSSSISSSAIAMRNKVARSLVKLLHEHGVCESGVFYPLAAKVVGARAVMGMIKDHTKIDELLSDLKNSDTIDRAFNINLIKTLKLELQHIAAERKLFTSVNAYLKNNADESEDLLVTFVKCQMLHS